MTGVLIVCGAIVLAIVMVVVGIALQKNQKTVSHPVSEEDLVQRVKITLGGVAAVSLGDKLKTAAQNAWKSKSNEPLDFYDEKGDRVLRFVIEAEKVEE